METVQRSLSLRIVHVFHVERWPVRAFRAPECLARLISRVSGYQYDYALNWEE